MIVGSKGYRKTLIKVALLSHGAVTFEYLEGATCHTINEFNEAGKEAAEIVKNAKS